MGDYGDVYDKTQILSQMRCETTSSVKECALRARSGDVHVARVVSLVVDAVVGLTLGLIAHVIVDVFVVAILQRIFLYLEVYSLHHPSVTVNCCWLIPNFYCNSASN